jgi:hypothetical protein
MNKLKNFKLFILLVIRFVNLSHTTAWHFTEIDNTTSKLSYLNELKLNKIENSLFVNDFPVYFICTFSFEQKNVTILFRRDENTNAMFVKHYFDYLSQFSIYKSIKITIQGERNIKLNSSE